MVPSLLSIQGSVAFHDDEVVASLGLCIVAVCSIPLGFWNLDDNILIQAREGSPGGTERHLLVGKALRIFVGTVLGR